MGLFSRKRKLDNAAGVAIPVNRPPMNTTIHNHSTGWAAIIAVSFVCAVAMLPVLWFALVFLFDQMGGSEKEAALLVVSVPVIFIAAWLLKWLIMAWLSESHSFKLEMARELTRREEVRLLHAQTTIEPGRYTEEDYQFARVVVSVMEVAYNWLKDKNLDKFPARWRPWSKTSVLETAEKIGITITQDRALSVAKWLADEGIITAADMGQIAKAYPTLSSVRAHLDNKYGRPIVSVSPTLRSNAGYVHIKN